MNDVNRESLIWKSKRKSGEQGILRESISQRQGIGHIFIHTYIISFPCQSRLGSVFACFSSEGVGQKWLFDASKPI